jgi:hypothetical protein
MSVAHALDGAEKWQKAMNKKKAIAEDADGIEEVFVSSCGNYRVVKLISENAFKREGNLMKHCVGSYYGRENMVIFSLRDDQNKPHCTMEMGMSTVRINDQLTSSQYIRQIRGNSNSNVKPEYVSPITEFLKTLGVDLQETQLGYLGYKEFPKKYIDILQEKGLKVRYIELCNKFFIFNDDLNNL